MGNAVQCGCFGGGSAAAPTAGGRGCATPTLTPTLTPTASAAVGTGQPQGCQRHDHSDHLQRPQVSSSSRLDGGSLGCDLYRNGGDYPRSQSKHDNTFSLEKHWCSISGEQHADAVTDVSIWDNLTAPIASSSHDQRARFQLLELSPSKPAQFKMFQSSLISTCWITPETFAVGSRSGDVLTVSTTNPLAPNAVSGGHQLGVTGLDCCGLTMCSGSRDCDVKFWDVTRLVCKGTKKILRNVVTSVSAMDENTFCQGSEDKTLRIWDARTSNVVLDFPKQKYILTSVSALMEGNSPYVITGCSGGGTTSDGSIVSIWDTRTGRKLRDIHAHSASASGCAFVSDSHFITCSKDHTVKLWSLTSDEALVTSVFDCALTCCASGPSGRLVVVGSISGRLYKATVTNNFSQFVS